MPGQIPNTVYVFRIIHVSNVEYLLTHGIFTKQSDQADPDYINIGDGTLIAQRKDYPVDISPPGGTLGEYIPFYFGPLSPMLFNIKTGFRRIGILSQEDILYICCKVELLTENCSAWCYTDGHAKHTITEFYNNLEHLDAIDWDIVSEKYWRNTEDDSDRLRRKQAEFLVKYHVPVNCIDKIIVLNEEKQNYVQNIIQRLGLGIEVTINPNYHFYY
jgi:hypothetical protein